MRVLVSGPTGLIGRALCRRLRLQGNEVVGLSRSDGPRSIRWQPAAGRLDPARVAGFDAVVHLAGENVAGGRWTEDRKRRIRNSRIDGTRLLVDALKASGSPPKVFASASAVGYYGSFAGGSRGGTDQPELDEQSPRGDGFLAEVAEAWEDASRGIEETGARRVLVRIGVVLDPFEGALGKMLLPFRLGLGGPVGSGRQWMPWITRDDVCRVFERTLSDDGLAGPVNAVTASVTNRNFARALGRAVSRPALLPLPGFAARLLFGEMGEQLLLRGQRVRATVLRERGHSFLDPGLDAALRRLLDASRNT